MAGKNDFLLSVRRTIVPIVAAFVVLQAARVGIALPGDAVSDVIFAVIASTYYTSARAIETRFPQASVLLGSLLQPTYIDANAGVDIGEHDDGE